MKKAITIFILLFPLFLPAQQPLNVLATNSWTAAYARAAGVENVNQLAPSAMVHPSEYELQITDLEKIRDADVIIYAGYEVVIAQIKQSLKLGDKKFIKIETGYAESQVVDPILQIAGVTGTQSQANISVGNYKKLYRELRDSLLKTGQAGKPVIVHFFQQGFVSSVGLKPVAVFGPAPLELFELDGLSRKEVVLIIDNAHNPIAQPLEEMIGVCRRVELLNFPGLYQTFSLEDVIRYNFEKISSK